MWKDKKRFDVENALNMFAYSYAVLPASMIYDEEAIARIGNIVSKCHVYLIGYFPVVEFIGMREKGSLAITDFEVAGEKCEIEWELPEGAEIKCVNGMWFIEISDGTRMVPSLDSCCHRLSEMYDNINFDVQYIGQAYGKGGARNAIDRLLKHETLQKIALQPIPRGHLIQLLLLEIHPDTRVLTLLNPNAEEKDQGEQRIDKGLQKLFGTSEEERITLYEATMIRYFKPHFNTEFKNSFPSTKMKILADCYRKDFSSVVAELCFDNLYFKIKSNRVKSAYFHIVSADLHKEEDRRVFFGSSLD